MKPIKILRLNRKHLSQMTYYFTSFQDNSCSHDGQSSICRIHSMQYIPVTPNMRDYNLLDSLGVAPDLERILDYAMLYGATYVELTGNDADIDPLLPTFKWTLDNDILYAILKDGEQMATYFAIGIDFPCHCIVPANFVLGSSDFSACIEDTLRRIPMLKKFGIICVCMAFPRKEPPVLWATLQMKPLQIWTQHFWKAVL